MTKRLTFEVDTEPYAKVRDEEIANLASDAGIQVVTKVSNTLFHPNEIVKVG
jgi:cryptochrome